MSLADDDGDTPLYMAAQEGYADVVAQLLAAGATDDAAGRARAIAEDQDDNEVVALLDAAADRT